jgi:hypothetical protein
VHRARAVVAQHERGGAPPCRKARDHEQRRGRAEGARHPLTRQITATLGAAQPREPGEQELFTAPAGGADDEGPIALVQRVDGLAGVARELGLEVDEVGESQASGGDGRPRRGGLAGVAGEGPRAPRWILWQNAAVRQPRSGREVVTCAGFRFPATAVSRG